MRIIRLIALAAVAGLAALPRAAWACPDPSEGLGVSRVVEIDTANGPLYRGMSRYEREESFLGPKEVVLTFDDGPMPAITKPILETLDKFCTKATFFSVGRMAIAYPAMTKEIMARGHTLGTHTWSHPLNLKRSGIERAREEIERGFSAVAMAAGQPIAPFFRFPGLSDSDPMLAHLQSRGIGAFTVDVVTNDSFIGDTERLIRTTVEQTVARNGGILLFHDIKRTTAKALPEILRQLKERGFQVVHMRAKAGYAPVPDYDAKLAEMMAKTTKRAAGTETKPVLIPMTAAATSAPDLVPSSASAKVPEHAPDIAHVVATTANVPPAAASTLVTSSVEPAAQVTYLAPAARARNGGSHDSARKRQQLATNDDSDSWFTVTSEPRAKSKPPATRAKRHRPPKPDGQEKRFFD